MGNGSIDNIDMARGYDPLYLTDTFTVLIMRIIVIDISNVELRIIISRNRRMLLRGLKSEGILEFIHHALGASLGDPRNNLIIGLRLLNTLKISDKGVFWS